MSNKMEKGVEVRFIKLGDSGKWEESCIENDNCIRLKYVIGKHKESLNGEWEKLREVWVNETEGTITRHINQIKDFYTLDENTIWITFYNRKLYWCKVSKEVMELEDKTRIRKVISNNGKWSCTDINGKKELSIDNLDGRITKVQGYQGTICGVQLEEYLIKKINGETDKIIEEIEQNIVKLKVNISELIEGLNPQDFELLVDLIFARLGLQRVSVIGGTVKDIDLDLLNPVNQNRIFVQIKSEADKNCFKKYIDIFDKHKQHKQYDEMYFVVHTSNDGLKALENKNENVTLIDKDKLPDFVINSGLISWLIEKRS